MSVVYSLSHYTTIPYFLQCELYGMLYMLCFVLIYRRTFNRKPRHRQYGYVKNVVEVFRWDEFKVFFRFNRTSFECLLALICQVCVDGDISGILSRQGSDGSSQKPLHDRLLTTLWYTWQARTNIRPLQINLE